jgi:hypothetical protein
MSVIIWDIVVLYLRSGKNTIPLMICDMRCNVGCAIWMIKRRFALFTNSQLRSFQKELHISVKINHLGSIEIKSCLPKISWDGISLVRKWPLPLIGLLIILIANKTFEVINNTLFKSSGKSKVSQTIRESEKETVSRPLSARRVFLLDLRNGGHLEYVKQPDLLLSRPEWKLTCNRFQLHVDVTYFNALSVLSSVGFS